MRRKASRRNPDWRRVQVLARIDPAGGYDPENATWRPARSEREAAMGMEDLGIRGEPLVLPMTVDQIAQREAMPVAQRRLFDIWLRMRWRSQATDGPMPVV
jgi:hypothetical protein